jgi:hypothetical protein
MTKKEKDEVGRRGKTVANAVQSNGAASRRWLRQYVDFEYFVWPKS